MSIEDRVVEIIMEQLDVTKRNACLRQHLWTTSEPTRWTSSS